MMRRKGSTAGFVLAEALVALAIAAMTVALLTSATWGLSAAADRRAAAEQTGAVDWLAARRAVIGWASGVTSASQQDSLRNLIGTASTARMVVAPSGAGQVQHFVGELRVEVRGDASFALMAARHPGLRDARTTVQNPRVTEILTATTPIRLLYLMPTGRAGQSAWRYETGSGEDGLPFAIGIEVGAQRMITVPLMPTLSASCLARLGPGGLADNQCALR